MPKENIKPKPEWHLYSVTAFVMAMGFFIITNYKGDQMATGLGFLALLVAPVYASDNWRLTSLSIHKSLFAISLTFILGWALHLISVNKTVPKILDDN